MIRTAGSCTALRHAREFLPATVLVVLLVGTARADDTPSYSYPAILLDDAQHVLTAPTRWQKPEWQYLGLAAVGVIGIAAIADGPVRDEMARHTPNDNRFMRNIERFGAQYSVGVLGGFYLAGAIGNNETATAVAQDGLTASIIASGIITPAIKFVTGRARPRENLGVAHLHPFSLSYSSNSSFPSGHTTEAFALASVISSHYEETWVACASYSVAGLVGVARSYHGAHFASDILAGALVGTLVGKSVVAHNKSLRPGNVMLLPEFTTGTIGVRLTSNF
ncbi:MAG: phosphatase PAP2 family protein [Gallionella sp.]